MAEHPYYYFYSKISRCCVISRHREKVIKSAFTCNRNEISSRDETRPGMKRVEFHPGMKFNLKEFEYENI